MKTRRFDFNFKPLQLQLSISVVGSVPDKQNYNGDINEYTPDYTLTPLILQPTVAVLDKDELIKAGSVNAKLTNVRWYEIVEGVKTLITTTNVGYEVTTTGEHAGRIKVKKNANLKSAITLQYYAEYVDERTKQIHTLQKSYLIRCTNAASLVTIELDAAEHTLYNPLTDNRTQVVGVKVRSGGIVCTDVKKYKLQWEIMGADGTWHIAGSDEMDYEVSIDAAANTATVDKWLMGDDLSLRCRCNYSISGTPSATFTDDSPSAMITFKRRIPAYDYDMLGVPYNIPPSTPKLHPTAVIFDANGEIPSSEKELLPIWSFATNKASGALSYTVSGHGKNPVISTELMSQEFGGVLALDVIDRGPAGAMVDGSGALICDGDGSILIIH